MSYTQEHLKRAHQASKDHREAVEANTCGCFYCLKTFPGSEVSTWSWKGTRALCPYCGIDSVLPTGPEIPVEDPEFLKAMHGLWFETYYTTEELKAARAEGREPVPIKKPS